jgi:hypothetical protein
LEGNRYFPREAHGDGGRYRLSFLEDVVKVLARNSEQAGISALVRPVAPE